MATNKWLSDLQALKGTTDILRDELRNSGIEANNTDTLSQLVSKVPLLSPIVSQDAWQPDPLWKFPDPNGTDTTKTIREIYDEDALASSYTYRGIYQIRGDLDTIDLKQCMNRRTDADTFILSDGTTYENITATTLEHTWDKTKDVPDSSGVPMRYIRIYTNTAYNYVIGFHSQSVWIIHNLGTSAERITGNNVAAITMSNNIYAQCIEFEDKCTSPFRGLSSSSSNSKIILGWSKKLVIKKYNNASSTFYVRHHHLKEIYFYDTNTTHLFDGLFANTEVIRFFNEEYAITSLSFNTFNQVSSNYSNHNTNILELNLSNFKKAKSLKMPDNCHRLKKVYLPPNITEFHTSTSYGGICGDLIELLDFPTTLITFNNRFSSQDNILNVKTLRFNSVPTTIYWGSIKGLKEFFIPEGWNTSLPNFSDIYLDKDIILGIFYNLADLTGSTAKTITLGTINLAKLTDEEKAIATNKNWTLS